MHRVAPFLVMLAAVAGCVDDAPAPEAPGDETPSAGGAAAPGAWSWDEASSPMLARTEATCGAVGGDIVLVGGFTNAGQGTPTVEVYNASRDTWTSGPPLPLPLHHAPVASVAGRVFVLGGYVGLAFMPVATAWSWAPDEPAWRAAPDLPIPRGAHGVAVLGERVFLVGGATMGGALTARVDVYDVRAGTWSSGPDLPTPRDHLAAGAVDGLVVAAGGRALTLTSNMDTTEVYDTATGAWREGAPMPTARGGVAAAPTPWGLVVVGGEEPTGTFDEVEAYDAAGNAWTSFPPMPTPRHGLCAAFTGDGLHTVTGGREPNLDVSDAHEVLAPSAPAPPGIPGGR